MLESQCSPLDFATQFRDIARKFHILGSDALHPCGGQVSGGVLVFVSKSYFAVPPSLTIFVPGRVVRVSLDHRPFGGGCALLWGVHNYGLKSLSPASRHRLHSAVCDDLALAHSLPTSCSESLLVEDAAIPAT